MVGVIFQALSQNYSGVNWYFGSNSEGIRFVRPQLRAKNVSTPFALGTGGSAVASDPITGEVIFTTDGNFVYDGMDRVLPTTLGGNTTLNQGVSIAQNPGNRDQFYIFTIDNGTGLLEFTVFDLTQYSGPPGFPAPAEGDLVGLPANTGLPATPRSSGMIIIPNDTRDGFWLISHQTGSTNYDVLEIDATGAFSINTQSVGAITNAVNLSFNQATSQIAVAPSAPTQTVEILSIDQSTGTLSLVTNIPGTNASTLGIENIYDTEWSNNGDFLYLSGNFETGVDSLMQVDLTQAVLTPRPIFTSDMVRSYGIQMAPDSAIYHLYENSVGSILLGKINAPDTLFTQVLYDPNTFRNVDFGGRQFPAFLPQINQDIDADFSFSGVCQNSPTLFYPTITPDSDSVRWDFGDGASSSQLAPSHTYADANTFDVTLTAFLNGDSVAVTKPVTITAFDIQISVRTDTTFCREDFPPPYGTNGTASVVAQISGTPTSVIWSNGDTGNTLTPDSSGYYYVIATNASGCTAHAGVTVNTYGEDEQRANVWYFGNNAGIDFNPLPDNPVAPIPFGNANIYNGGNQLQAPEGCAIYCDRNGQPVFYTDGLDVFDSDGNQLTGATPADKLGGDPTATQSVLIVPFPGDETLFYIFTTEEVYGTGTYDLKYSVFDLKDESNGTKGALVRTAAGDLTTTISTGVTERITGNDSWVIVHDFGNDNFKAFPILGDGIGNPVVSSVGSSHDTDRESEGYMILGPGDILAVALSESANNNYIELFNFADSTGAIDEITQLDFNNPAPISAGVDGVTAPSSVNGQVYGIGFSPDGSNLFATLQGASESHIYWWPLDSTTTTANTTDPSYIRDSVRYVSGSNLTLGALQAGPDGVLYISQEGQGSLATITNPGLNIGEVPIINGFGLSAGTTSQLGLPNFIQNIGSPFNGASLVVMNGCDGDALTISIFNAQNLESYYLNIYNQNDLNTIVRGTRVLDQDNPDFTFTLNEPGTYVATVTIDPECSGISNTNMTPQTFVVNPLPDFDLAVVSGPSICGANDGVISVDFASSGDISYTVNGPVSYAATTVTGPGTFNVNGLSAGFYTVTANFLATGCSDTRTISLNDPTSYTPDDQPVNSKCSNAEGELNITFSPSSAAPASYSWRLLTQGSNLQVASGTEANIPFQFISTGEYYLEITDAGGCLTFANVSATPPPPIDLELPTEFSVCDEAIARVPYQTSSNQLASTNPTMQIEGDSIILVTEPGTYTVTAFGDGTNTCDIQRFLTVSFSQSDPIPFDSRYAICPEDPLVSNTFVTIPTPGFSRVEYFDEDGNPLQNGNGYNIFADSIQVFVTGIVNVRMTNAFGCVTEAEFNVIEDCKARINAPNAFTPNGDGRNDNFLVFPVLVSPDDFQIFIFNRWGEMVFQSSDLNFEWNGGYNNDPSRPLTGGTYAYRVEFKSVIEGRDDLQEMRGGVTLIR
ncbi:gliding motility-associated C-terminal domain-containing protein [Fulvivirga sp. 29W222]|uniref:Gliding motility-associated C-terminal domain-containing protein n=1 Tax=Fulvivirga marina TaxID=2494733 RepID=A0A937G0F5_9BACT|nr:gliding motility-associated C-terminal domain-containing protein [Fulvivirga marina]MBL6448357.1 gliding motility-associated C-terminal domain-containing protein [Fulvivirga marina]